MSGRVRRGGIFSFWGPDFGSCGDAVSEPLRVCSCWYVGGVGSGSEGANVRPSRGWDRLLSLGLGCVVAVLFVEEHVGVGVE